MPKFIKKPLNYDPLVSSDYFKPPIRKSMIGFFLSLTITIGLYIMAISYISAWILTIISGCVILLNFYLFFYDKSLHFSPKFFGKGFNKINFPSLRTHMTKICLDPAQNTIKDPLEKKIVGDCNLMLISNQSNHKVVAVLGLSLRSTALHIQSNFENFLRVMYSLKMNVPLTFQIDLKNMGVQNKHSNSIYGDNEQNLKNETLFRESHSVFEYTIFIKRTYRFPTKKNMDNLLYTMKQSYITVLNVLETNFAHFKFSILEGDSLIDSIKGSITGKRHVSSEKNTRINSVSKDRRKVLWIRPLLVFFGNICALWFLAYRINDNILYYGVIVLSVICSIALYLNFWWSHFFDFNANNFEKINLFPQGEFMHHKLTKSLHYYDYSNKKIYSKIHYSMTNFNKAFRFNQVKFYRSLLKHVVSGNFSVSIQFHTRRISSMDRFKNNLSEDFLEKWEDRPHLRSSLERKYCGFYFFQSVFSLGMVKDQNIIDVSDSDLITNVKTLQNTFLPLFSISFPNCGLVSLKPNVIYQYITKSRLYSTFNSIPNLHFTSGLSLIPFIAIPEEIHKYLPINYAGEFSTPLLQDEIIFGHTFNPENNSIETAGGISFNELKENIMFLGESYKDTQKGLTRLVVEFLTHRFPCIIFDWDGTWKHLIGQLEFHNSLNNINYVTVGKNFGMELFDLPYNKKGPLFISYISSIVNVFGDVFHYGDDQLALLKSMWGSIKDDIITFESINEKLSYDGIKEYYTDKNPVIADLKLLQKDFLAKSFDKSIENWISPEILLDESSTIIINLEALKDNNLRKLFIQAFLAQYQYLFEMELNNIPNKIPRIIVLPVLDILFNNKVKLRQNTQINSTLLQLIKQQHILVGIGTNISEIHQTIFNLFKNRFVFRTQLKTNQRIIDGFLNFDQNFTNIQHLESSSRKISYQSNYMSTIDPDKCIILRPSYNTPYVFQFDYANYFESDNMNRISESKIEKFELTPERILSEKELKKNKTILESDFSKNSSIVENLYQFLKTNKEKLNHVAYLSKDQILTNLHDLLVSMNSDGEYIYTQTFTNELFNELVELNYLASEMTAGGKTHEIKGYKLTTKAIDCLKEYEFEKIHSVPTIKKTDQIIYSEETREKAISKDENILPATIFPKKDENEKTNEIKWMDDFELELSEIIVPCRIIFEKGNFEESYEYLKSGWEKAMEKIENNPQTNGLIETFRKRYQWIKETDSTKENELLKLINRIEYFIISI